MGMRGYVSLCEVEVVDEEGLKEFRDKVKRWELGYECIKPSEGSPDLERGCYLANSIRLKSEMSKEAQKQENIFGDGDVYFDWNDWKINGYWYKHFVMFLRDLAPFLEGEVHICCDEAEQNSRIHWNNGVCKIEIGTMQWSEFSTDELVGEVKMPTDEKYVPMDPWVKAKQLLRGGI